MKPSGQIHLFAYGTLKPGGRYWQAFCEGRVVAAMPAKARGVLYDLPAGYPAARFGGDCWIHGFVLVFTDPADLAAVDGLEGYDPAANPERNEYRRLEVECYDPAGGRIGPAWSYEMSGERISAMGGSTVAGGDWPASQRHSKRGEA